MCGRNIRNERWYHAEKSKCRFIRKLKVFRYHWLINKPADSRCSRSFLGEGIRQVKRTEPREEGFFHSGRDICRYLHSIE